MDTIEAISTDKIPMVKRRKDPATGKFYSEAEPNDKFIGLRLPESLFVQLKQTYGDAAQAFIREAIAEKMERERSCNTDLSSDKRTISNQIMVSL